MVVQATLTGSEDSVEVRQIRRNMSPDPGVSVSLIFAVDSTGINNGVWLLTHSFMAPFLRRPAVLSICYFR